MKCNHCEIECEQIPYPRGQRWICPSCGTDHSDADAQSYKRKQREELNKLLETLNNSGTYQHKYIKGDAQ